MNDKIWIGADGSVHSNRESATEASQRFEGVSGQWVTGGNCPQDPQFGQDNPFGLSTLNQGLLGLARQPFDPKR